MNIKLKKIRRKIEAIDIAQDKVTSLMREVFPEGKEIVFKRSGMKREANAIVVWARMINSYAEIRIVNTRTGKDRTISFSDVVEI